MAGIVEEYGFGMVFYFWLLFYGRLTNFYCLCFLSTFIQRISFRHFQKR